MKKINLLLAFVILTISGAFAQTPQQFKYQAVLRDAGGSIMASESVNVNVKIMKTTADGTEVFSEDHNGLTTTAQGLININVGETEDLSVVNWGDDIYFLKITVNGVEMGTSQLLSVPYALNAGNAYWSKKADGEIYFDQHNVGVGTNNPIALLDVTRNSTETNAQVWVEQKGTGDATMVIRAAGITYGIGVDQSDESKFKISRSYDVANDNVLTIKTTGELGIGTTDPTAKLQVVGGTKIGASANAVNIAEVIEVTGTTSASSSYESFDFPAGFTKENTRILNYQIEAQVGTVTSWRGTGTVVSGSTGSMYTSVSSKIWLYYPNNADYKGKPYRITLMKVQ